METKHKPATPLPMTNIEKAAAKVEAEIVSGNVLVAYSALDRGDFSVGPYTEAVDRGFRFAVIGNGRTASRQREFRTAKEAAYSFVNTVGSTRAREAAIG